MLSKKEGAGGTAPNDNQQEQVYHNQQIESRTINATLTGLLLGLQLPHLTPSERGMVIDSIDGLLRLKIDLGLLRGVNGDR